MSDFVRPDLKMDPKKFEEIRRICERTPLFAQALVPQHVISEGRLKDYDPWIVCHWEESRLSQVVMDKLYPAFQALENPQSGEEMSLFSAFLAVNGYIVLHTANGGSGGPLTVNPQPTEAP